MKKIVTVYAFLLLSIAALQAQDNRALINKVIGNVGEEYLMLSEVEEQVALSKERNPKLPDDYRCLVVDNLLTQKLLVNQAKLDSVAVSDDEIETQLNQRIDQILGYMNGDESQFESYYGQSIAEVKGDMRNDLKDQILAERMRGQVLEKITITPAEVKQFFNEIPKDSLPYFNAEVEIREIVMQPTANATERQKALDKLNDIRTRIADKGEDFAALATKFSMDPGSGRIGGDLGWAKRGKFVQEFEAAAYNLEEKALSPVIETEFGFHIIQLLERRGNNIHARHILIKPEITDADMELTRLKLDSVRTEIVRDSLTFSKAVKRFSDKNMQSYNNDGLILNPQAGSSVFETGELDSDIYFAIEKLKVGELSPPIKFTTASGEKAFRTVKLESRIAPHRANLKQDFTKIQNAALESKKADYLSKWVEQKVMNTFIQIDPMYRNCTDLKKWNLSR